MFIFFGGVGAEPVVETTFLGNDETDSGATAYTFSSKSLGTATSDRQIVVYVNGGNQSRTISSVTVAGVTATHLVTNSITSRLSAIYIASVPTGTTGDIVVTWSGANDRCSIGWWGMTGAESTAHDTDTNLSASGGVPNGSIDVPDNGCVIGGVFMLNSGSGTVTASWTGITEDYDNVINASPLWTSHSGAHDDFETGESGKTISMTFGATLGNGQPGLTLVSFGPA